MSKDLFARLEVLCSMVVFGTVGIFVKYIPLPSSVIAAARGIIGVIFLFAVVFIKREKLKLREIKENLLLLTLSGAAIGFNWILLFESYKYTTVAAATLCYYLAPVFVVFASPLVLRERLTAKSIISALCALFGMVFVSGVLDGGITGGRGILLASGAALLYATVILLNKKIRGLSPLGRTLLQLCAASVVISPYAAATSDIGSFSLNGTEILLLITVGVLHTGLAYFLYFGGIKALPAQTAAILSYIDPVVAVLLSVFLLGEGMTLFVALGAVLILGGSLLNELSFGKKH